MNIERETALVMLSMRRDGEAVSDGHSGVVTMWCGDGGREWKASPIGLSTYLALRMGRPDNVPDAFDRGAEWFDADDLADLGDSYSLVLAAAAAIRAERGYGDRLWTYHDDATNRDYAVTATELEALGAALRDRPRDAANVRSEWSAETPARDLTSAFGALGLALAEGHANARETTTPVHAGDAACFHDSSIASELRDCGLPACQWAVDSVRRELRAALASIAAEREAEDEARAQCRDLSDD